MRLKLILPTVDPTSPIRAPDVCPRPGCRGPLFQLHPSVPKPVRDTRLDQTITHRMRCVPGLRNGRRGAGVRCARVSPAVYDAGPRSGSRLATSSSPRWGRT